ncbi:MAG: molybdopterin-dependent oxidoreductase [Nevskiales bacterium]
MTSSETTIKTTCAYCGVGCGVLATPDGKGAAAIEGDKTHGANLGRLCSKGSALGETLDMHGRLLQPIVNGEPASWDDALDAVASGFKRIIDVYGPESVAFYVSGQLLTEDYYVANKLMKGYIGSANIDTNSRLCMSSAVMGYKRAFGGDLVPNSYEDLEQADLVVLAGSNTAWCHPIVYQRIVAAKEARPQMKVVVIDPRRTATCEIADLHLSLNPGSDVMLFNGLLTYLHEHECVDVDFVQQHCSDPADTLKLARESAADVSAVAQACGLREADVAEFFRLFLATEKTVSLFSQGVNQSIQGTDKVNAIINCHLLTGRVGKPGMGPFSITGQPNAMGGREVGGLSTMLAAHMNIQDASHRELVQGFWASPTMATEPGLKAVDLFDAIHDGRVKAVWIMATNPVVSLPNANHVREALEKCELVVASDVMANTDTVDKAHIKLPALGWGEKDGTVTNSERRISRQRAFLPAPGEAKADWWIMCEVAKRMQYTGFEYRSVAEIFDEHARLSGHENEGQRCFNIAGLAGLDEAAYNALEPIQWPVPSKGHPGTERLFEDKQFYTPDGKAQFVAVEPKAPANAVDDDYPLVLNSGRVRDQWHTMTRTGKAPRLGGHIPEPYVQIHPRDAMLCGVKHGELGRVASRWGNLVVRIEASGEIPRGQVFVPIHWNKEYASDARVGQLVNPAVDPVSGEPEFKHTPVRVEPFLVDWHGFVLSRKPLKIKNNAYWVKVQGEQFLRYELAGRGKVRDWEVWGRSLLGVNSQNDDVLEVCDPMAGLYRAALVENDQIQTCVFVSQRPEMPSRAWLSGLFAKDKLEEVDRVGLLVGKPADPAADVGPLVCSCFGVGRNVITRAIDEQGLTTTGQIGECLKAGTNCGSCVPELKKLLQQAAPKEAA